MPSHLIIGSDQAAHSEAEALAGRKIISSPDCFLVAGEESLKIADVRAVKHFLTRKPYQENTAIVYLPRAERLTVPAQNALLKTLEEPPSYGLIILTSEYPDRLLPTVISRCQLSKTSNPQSTQNTSQANNEFANIEKQLAVASIPTKVFIAQAHTFPKTKAEQLCHQALIYYREKMKARPSAHNVQNVVLAQKSLTALAQNADSRLVIEHLFLHLAL